MCNLQQRDPNLVKHGFSVYMTMENGERQKWHISRLIIKTVLAPSNSILLAAYFVSETIHQLRTTDDVPDLSALEVPYNIFMSVRKPRECLLEMSYRRPRTGVNPFPVVPATHSCEYLTIYIITVLNITIR